MSEEEAPVPAIVKVFKGLKESVFGAMDQKSRSIMSDLSNVQDILRPALTKIAHANQKPYVEPTIETDFLLRWEESENKEEILNQVTQKYQQMLQSIPDRDKWRL